jgi:hypothetical protein
MLLLCEFMLCMCADLYVVYIENHELLCAAVSCCVLLCAAVCCYVLLCADVCSCSCVCVPQCALCLYVALCAYDVCCVITVRMHAFVCPCAALSV